MNRVPESLLSAIFAYLKFEDIINCSFVCKAMNADSESSFNMILSRIEKSLQRSFDITSISKKKRIRLLGQLCNDKILLLGGGQEGGAGKTVDILDISSSKWSTANEMIMKHGSFHTEAVSFNGMIYVVSGDNADSVGHMESYNIFDNVWNQCSAMPAKLMFISAASYLRRKKIIVSGGIHHQTGQFSRSLFSYNCNDTWVQLPTELLNPRYGHASIVFEGKLWVVGGEIQGKEGFSESVEIVDMETGDCIAGPKLTKRRMWLTLIVISGILYAVGGDSTVESQSKPSIEFYDSVAKKWKHETFLPAFRRLYSSAASGSMIHIFGGKDESYCQLNDSDCYDTFAKRWVTLNKQSSLNPKHSIDTKESKILLPRESFSGGRAITLSFLNYL